jgi:hypothetical protein
MNIGAFLYLRLQEPREYFLSPKRIAPRNNKLFFLSQDRHLLHHLNMPSSKANSKARSNARRLQTAAFKAQSQIEKAIPKNTKKAYWPKQKEWRVSSAIRMVVKRPLPCNRCPASPSRPFFFLVWILVANTCATNRHSAENRNGRMVSLSPKTSSSSSFGYRKNDR